MIREFGSGLLLGLLLGIIAFGRAMLWGSGVQLSLVVALAIIAICVWANTIGSLIPLLAQRFKIDPALVSAPLITTLVDATGLAIYLLIAKLLLSALGILEARTPPKALSIRCCCIRLREARYIHFGCAQPIAGCPR